MGERKTCYLYTRVSTEMQIDGYSLEAQKQLLIDEAKHRGFTIIGEYSDEGKSGKNISGRPEFQRMLNDIADETKEHADYVFVFKLSRFGRNAADTLSSVRTMKKYNTSLLCVKDGLDSGTSTGNLMIAVLAAVAEIERENIREQTMAGREQKARDGKWNGGFAPYGYMLVADSALGIKKLVINEEAELIRLIYKKYAETTLGYNGVAKWLDENGYTKEIRQNGTLENISGNFVKSVLDNPVYMGKIAYGRRRNEKIKGTDDEYHVIAQPKDSYELYNGIHEAIIDEELWLTVEAKRSKNAFKRPKTHSLEHEHIFSGLLKCPECDAPMYGVVNRKKKKKGKDEYYSDLWYYHCKNRKMVTGHKCSYKKHIRQEQINAEILAIIKTAMSDEAYKKKAFATMGDSSAIDELEETLKRLKTNEAEYIAKKNALQNQIKNLEPSEVSYEFKFNMIMASVDELFQKLSTVQENIQKTETKILNAKRTKISAKVFFDEFQKQVEHLDEKSDEELKAIAQEFISEIHIYPEQKTDGSWVQSVSFRVPITIEGQEYKHMLDLKKHDESFLSKERHDETVVLLSQQKADDHIEVELDLDEIDVTAAETKATYKEIHDYIFEKTGLNVTNLNIAQVKDKLGMDKRKNYNLPKSEDARQPKCTPEKEEAIKEAFRKFGMV